MLIKKRLHSGKFIDVAALTVDDICLSDIVHSLSMTCRYDGHVPRHYSVLEHSLAVCNAMPRSASPHIKLLALLHDATECYIGDMQSGIKDRLSIELDGELVPVRDFEARILRTICDKFNVKVRMHYWTVVEAYDHDVTALEMDYFFEGDHNEMFKYRNIGAITAEFYEKFEELTYKIKSLEDTVVK